MKQARAKLEGETMTATENANMAICDYESLIHENDLQLNIITRLNAELKV